MGYIPPHRKSFVRTGDALLVPDAACELADPTAAKVRLRRRGDVEFFVEYLGWARTDDGAVMFLLDALLWDRAYGRYEAELSYDGILIGSLELHYRADQRITPGRIETLAQRVADYPARPTGATNVFNAIQSMSFVLTGTLEKGERLVPLSTANKAALCGASIGAAAEFELTDGYQTELVKFTACTAGEVLVDRAQSGTTQKRFPKGAIIRFVWSQANVEAATA